MLTLKYINRIVSLSLWTWLLIALIIIKTDSIIILIPVKTLVEKTN